MKLLLAPLTVLAALVMVALALPGAVNADDAPTNNPLAGTGWYLLENKGAPMIEGTSITLSFDKNGQVGGSGGCNSYGGSYTVDGNSLRFSDVFSTLMACVDNMLNQQEADYFAALSQVTGYRRIGPERLVLDLSDGSALVFVAIPALPGSAWVLIDDGLPSRERLITADSGVTLTFDKDGGADIDTGCNGSYYTTYRLEVGALT
nr:META domain-containing protein [Anaerolineae bacterium]